MNKAIFLDRDGTINVEKQYLYKIEDFELLPGVLDGLSLLQNADFLLIIITNQSGIARGYYREEDFIKLNSWMIKYFCDRGIKITKVYYCPHLPDAPVERYRINCQCRKPALGMFKQAIQDYDIDLNTSYAIGDKIRDCAICRSTPCRGYLIGEIEKPEIISDVKNGKIHGVKYSDDLYHSAIEIIGMTPETPKMI